MKLFQTITSGNHTTYLLFCIAILVLVFLIGITFFSYLNVVIERLPKGEKLVKGRSACGKCGHAFTFLQSIPIISYLVNKGKCPYCLEKMPVRNIIIEFIGGIIGIVLVLYYGLSIDALVLFLLYSILMVITMIDNDTMEIPFVLNVMLFVLGIISYFVMPGPSILERVIGFFCISAFMYIVILIIPEGFGGGDIKMIAAAGVFLGWKATVVAFFISLLIGGAYAAYLWISGKKDKGAHFAFGPFLAVGVAIAAFGSVGTYLMNLYLSPMLQSFKQF